MNHKEDLIAGRNAVIEALRAKKPIDKIFVLDGCQDGPIRTIVREAKKTDAILKFVDKERLNQLTNEHHQGVVAIVAAYEYGTIDDLFKRAEEKGEDPSLSYLMELKIHIILVRSFVQQILQERTE